MTSGIVRIKKSGIVPAPIESVWSVLGSYNGMTKWHSGVKDSIIEDNLPDNQIGIVRRLTLESGGFVRERLLAMDAVNFKITYNMEEGLPVKGYVATTSLYPITESNQTLFEWKAEFECDDVEKWTTVVGEGVFVTGINSMKKVAF